MMQSLKIHIVNHKAENRLQDVADLDLITIETNGKDNRFASMLEKLRDNADKAPTLEEITEGGRVG